jgi:hypothetical protein
MVWATALTGRPPPSRHNELSASHTILPSHPRMLRSLQKELRSKGFDLCHPIYTKWYNDMIRAEGLVASGALKTLPEPFAIEDDSGTVFNAVLIGNTKHIWPIFLNWLTDQKEGIERPFDTFVETSLPSALEKCLGNNTELESYELFWSNGKRHLIDQSQNSSKASSNVAKYHCYDFNNASFLVSMQRVATTTGKYWHDEKATKLCVHPEYGTWTAFRAVVVFKISNNTQTEIIPEIPQPCVCPVSDRDIEQAKKVFDLALKLSSSDENGYGATLDKSWTELCKYLHNTVCSGSDWDKVPSTMKPWIRLRDVISVGRNWKYDDAQLLYHYTKDPEILKKELNRIRKYNA